jgi:hypothetical protein
VQPVRTTRLTPAQARLLAAIATGMSTDEIAQHYGMPPARQQDELTELSLLLGYEKPSVIALAAVRSGALGSDQATWNMPPEPAIMRRSSVLAVLVDHPMEPEEMTFLLQALRKVPDDPLWSPVSTDPRVTSLRMRLGLDADPQPTDPVLILCCAALMGQLTPPSATGSSDEPDSTGE